MDDKIRTLILMRHGTPEANGSLSAQGQQQASTVAQQMSDSLIVPEVILYSPTPRAAQTAEKVNEVFTRLGHKPAFEQADWLKEEAQESPLLQLFNTSPDTHCIMYVTHQPPIYGLTTMFADPHKANHAEAFAYQAQEWTDYLSKPQQVRHWAP